MGKYIYHLGDTTTEVELRYVSSSRTMNLRLDYLRDQLVLSLPPATPSHMIKSFLDRAQNWTLFKLHNKPLRTPFEEGYKIPIFGEEYLIKHHFSSRSRIFLEKDVLLVHGPLENVPCSIKAWLKHQAHKHLKQRAHEYAAQLHQTIHSVCVREVKSRWGSCSNKGNLSFSWRLIFAPLPVVDYVCAHEVAHLVEMNHSQRFWAVVETLCPTPKIYIKWLKKNAPRLFSYG